MRTRSLTQENILMHIYAWSDIKSQIDLCCAEPLWQKSTRQGLRKNICINLQVLNKWQIDMQTHACLSAPLAFQYNRNIQPSLEKHSSNHLSVHQWIRSAIHASQQRTCPIVAYPWNFRHRLVRYDCYSQPDGSLHFSQKNQPFWHNTSATTFGRINW